MTDLVNLYSSWSHPRTAKPHPRAPFKNVSTPSSPIPIPRRTSVRPPPCSPTRGQDSPELVFNFDFSISPDAPDITTHIVQQRGANARRHPLQKAAYAPLATLDINHQHLAHPYAQEPFLYPVPKQAPCTEKTLSKVGCPDDILHASKKQITRNPSPLCTTEGSHAASPSSACSSRPRFLPSTTASSWHADADEVLPLTSAFQGPLMSDSPSSHNSMLSSQGCRSFLVSPNTPYRTPSPSPPRPSQSGARMQQVTLQRPAALQRTKTAAPVVSLIVTQAERSDRSLGANKDESSRSPGSGTLPPRTRRSSSVGAGLDLAKLRDPTRRMATVVGRGAGRVISMFEYGNISTRSLVSDEDIEGSLEKDLAGRSRIADCDRKLNPDREKGGLQGGESPVLERGRARSRIGTAAPNHMRVLPGLP